jgi:predicted nucleic acid-binding protein
MRIMLDSNVHDLVAADPSTLAAIKQRIADGQLKLISTHIQRDELSRAPEPKRTQLLKIYGLAEKVSTTGAVWDVSSWDECSWADDATSAAIVAMVAGNTKHAEDALIAATASDEADALVTNETRLASKIRRAGFAGKVWSWDEFAGWLS